MRIFQQLQGRLCLVLGDMNGLVALALDLSEEPKLLSRQHPLRGLVLAFVQELIELDRSRTLLTDGQNSVATASADEGMEQVLGEHSQQGDCLRGSLVNEALDRGGIVSELGLSGSKELEVGGFHRLCFVFLVHAETQRQAPCQGIGWSEKIALPVIQGGQTREQGSRHIPCAVSRLLWTAHGVCLLLLADLPGTPDERKRLLASRVGIGDAEAFQTGGESLIVLDPQQLGGFHFFAVSLLHGSAQDLSL